MTDSLAYSNCANSANLPPSAFSALSSQPLPSHSERWTLLTNEEFGCRARYNFSAGKPPESAGGLPRCDLRKILVLVRPSVSVTCLWPERSNDVYVKSRYAQSVASSGELRRLSQGIRRIAWDGVAIGNTRLRGNWNMYRDHVTGRVMFDIKTWFGILDQDQMLSSQN